MKRGRAAAAGRPRRLQPTASPKSESWGLARHSAAAITSVVATRAATGAALTRGAAARVNVGSVAATGAAATSVAATGAAADGWDSVIVIENGGWRTFGNAGLTLGHVVILKGTMSSRPDTYAHELAHVEQHDYLGPAYLPLHVLSQAYSWLKGGSYDQNNFLEIGPNKGRVRFERHDAGRPPAT